MEKVLIIAEAGVNHNGSLKLAKQLVDVAAAAGVDIVKFQTFRAENLVSEQAVQADYQKRNLGSSDQSQFSMLKKLDYHRLIIGYYLNTAGKKEYPFFLRLLTLKV